MAAMEQIKRETFTQRQTRLRPHPYLAVLIIRQIGQRSWQMIHAWIIGLTGQTLRIVNNGVTRKLERLRAQQCGR